MGNKLKLIIQAYFKKISWATSKNCKKPSYAAEVPGSNFFDSDSGSDTVQSWNPIPVPVPRLSMSRTRFRFRFRDCTVLKLDSDSGSETPHA